MALSSAEEKRLSAIEKAINDLQTALNLLATKKLVKSLTNIRQTEVNQVLLDLKQFEATSIGPELTAHLTDSTAHAEINSRFYQQSEFTVSSTGALSAGDPIILDSLGLISPSMINLSDTDVPNTITLDDITQITNRSHTSLTAIGTNTHAQIDTHITDFTTHTTDSSAHTELNNRYFQQSTFITATSGVVDASKPILSDALGQIDADFMPSGLQLDGSRVMTAELPLASLTSSTILEITPTTGVIIHDTVSGFQGYDGTWKKLDQNFEAFQDALVPTGTTQTIDFSTGRNQVIDLDSATGDVTLTLSNPNSGTVYIIKVIQGSTARDLVWPSSVIWPASTAPVISTGDNDIDIIQLLFDGTNYISLFTQAFG